MPVNALIDVLEKMTALHKEILRLSGEKQQILIAGDIPRLEKMVQLEDRLIRRLVKLEEERQAALRNVCEEYRINGEALTLSDLIEKMESETEKRRLKEIHQELSRILAELKALNETNQELIRQSLEFVNYSLELIASGPDSSVTYQKPLESGNPSYPKKSMFDFKV